MSDYPPPKYTKAEALALATEVGIHLPGATMAGEIFDYGDKMGIGASLNGRRCGVRVERETFDAAEVAACLSAGLRA